MELEGGEREWRGVEEGFALSEFATSSAGTVRVMVEAPSPTYDEEEEVERACWRLSAGEEAGPVRLEMTQELVEALRGRRSRRWTFLR